MVNAKEKITRIKAQKFLIRGRRSALSGAPEESVSKKGVCECHRAVILNQGSGGRGQSNVGFV
jgi:hypothetical protein